MPTSPPQLPRDVLRRVIRAAVTNGSTVLGISGVLAILSALYGDGGGALAGFVIAGAGAMELMGVRRLRRSDPSGVRLLVTSQIYLLAAILGYVVWKLTPAQANATIHQLEQMMEMPMMRAALDNAGVTASELVQIVGGLYRIVLILVAGVSALHQGGMAIYYSRRREKVELALRNHSERPLVAQV